MHSPEPVSTPSCLNSEEVQNLIISGFGSLIYTMQLSTHPFVVRGYNEVKNKVEDMVEHCFHEIAIAVKREVENE